jgi:predicted permease
MAVLTLGLGIGATVTVFSVGEAVLLRPLPYPDAHELVDISHWTVEGEELVVSRLEVPDLRQLTDVFQSVGARYNHVTDLTFETGEGPPGHALALRVSYNYLSILGVRPFLGRTFLLEDAIPAGEAEEAEEEAAPRGPAVVLTYGFWQRALGGDPNISEVTFRVFGYPYRILGVLPQDFRILHEQRLRWVRGSNVEVFIVWPEQYFTYPGPRTREVLPLARLKPGVSPQQAQAATGALSARLRAEVPRYERSRLQYRVRTLREKITAGSRPILLVLTGGVLFLMLLVCANLASLMLVRGRVRTKEDAVRATVGCDLPWLMGHRFVESILLVFGGGLIGIGFSLAAIQVFEVMAPRTVPLLDQVGMNLEVLLAGLGAALVLVLLFGLIPALQIGRLNLVSILNSDGRGASGSGRQKLMNTLVVSEVALSMVLLTGAAIMSRTLVRMTEEDFGFDAERVLTFDLSIYAEDFRTQEGRAAVYAELDERLETLPGVEAVARTYMPPLAGQTWSAVYGWDPESVERGTERADLNVSTNDYFKVLGTRLVAGRFFTEAENTDSTEFIIVDEKLASIAWPNEDPIGKRLNWRLEGQGVVVGVVEHMFMRDFGIESAEAIHQPEGTIGLGLARTFVVRSGTPPETLVPQIRQVLRSIHPTFVPYNVTKLSDRVDLSMAPTRFVVFLMGSFAAIAFVVAVTGLFGVISYAVQTRTAELGVRMALGAEKRKIKAMVLWQGALLTAIGIVVGIIGVLLLGSFMESMVFGVSPTDPVIFLATAAVLAAVSVLACYAPARRACRLDPAQVLRTD